MDGDDKSPLELGAVFRDANGRVRHNFPVVDDPFEDVLQLLLYRQAQGVIDGMIERKGSHKDSKKFLVLSAYFNERHAAQEERPRADYTIEINKNPKGSVLLKMDFLSEDAKRIYRSAYNLSEDTVLPPIKHRFYPTNGDAVDRRYKALDVFVGYFGLRTTELAWARGYSVPMPMFY